MDAADLFVLAPMLQVSVMPAHPVFLSRGVNPCGCAFGSVPAGFIRCNAASSAAVVYNEIFN